MQGDIMSKMCEPLKEKLLESGGIKENFTVYEKSIVAQGSDSIFMIKTDSEKKLVLSGTNENFKKFDGKVFNYKDEQVKICSLTHVNAKEIRALLPFTAPKSLRNIKTTIGVGDRLGLATPGHTRVFSKYEATPVLAQQSIRELNLTGRTYEDVLDDATWGVLQEGYTDGFGADGDHLKTESEIEMALNAGFNMITLDCSEYIDNSIYKLSKNEIETKYNELDINIRENFENNYTGTFNIDNLKIEIDKEMLMGIVLVYHKMLDFIEKIYNRYIKAEDEILFEISIDETEVSTMPEAHYLIAKYLKSGNIVFQHMAPRFIGEFQKGIDYIGDIESFKKDFKLHALIAKHFGYKISVHSGSDKFSVFPVIGEITEKVLHLKTAGTNWLEAIKVIAKKDASLYREIHSFALEAVSEAKKYYHISGREENIPRLSDTDDNSLIDYLYKDDSRQIIHITYGLILNKKDGEGNFLYRDRFYNALHKYEEEYCNNLESHIGKHLTTLGFSE
jgi:hypothetical protein